MGRIYLSVQRLQFIWETLSLYKLLSKKVLLTMNMWKMSELISIFKKKKRTKKKNLEKPNILIHSPLRKAGFG